MKGRAQVPPVVVPWAKTEGVIIEGDPKLATSGDQDLETASSSSSSETEEDPEVLSHYHQTTIVRPHHIYP